MINSSHKGQSQPSTNKQALTQSNKKEGLSNSTTIELTTIGNEPVIDSRTLSKGVGVEHKHQKRLISAHKSDIESFGVLSFENSKPTSKKGGRPETYYLLNEGQACFVITLSKNTRQVIKFKKRLVTAFLKMRKALARQAKRDWIEARENGKLCRREETDIIKRFVSYSKGLGSINAHRYYCIFSNLAQKTLFGSLRNRDLLSPGELSMVALAEKIIDSVILACLES